MVKKLLLVGAGHAHLYIAKRACLLKKSGIDVSLVDPGMFWYSGMATGLLSRMYSTNEIQIDPKTLIEKNGGHFYRDRLVDIDLDHKIGILSSGEKINYDALSLNIGSENIKFQTVDDSNTFSVKPIENLLHLRTFLENRFKVQPGKKLKVVIIGGGATGCEIAANLKVLGKKNHCVVEVRIITQSDRLLPEYSLKISKKMEEILSSFGVGFHLSQKVLSIENNIIKTLEKTFEGEVIIIATGLRAPEWLPKTGLRCGKEGSMVVNSMMQSVSRREIFGAGDCVSLEGKSLPKIGVYGVREAPYLYHNIRALLSEGNMKEFHPQKKYLSILNLGDGTGFAIRNPYYWHGTLSYLLKDWIDRKFLAQYQVDDA